MNSFKLSPASKHFVRNVGLSFSSNLVSLLINALTVLIVPRFVGTEIYGFYQLYIFFYSYVPMTNLGWNDGVYLREGGNAYKDLDFGSYAKQFRWLSFFEFLLYFVFAFISLYYVESFDRKIVVAFVCISATIVNPRHLLTSILDATNEIKKHAIITVVEIGTCFLVTICILLANQDSGIIELLIADLIGKIAGTICAVYFCKDIVFRKRTNPSKAVYKEVKTNISAGIKLMIATLSSMLVIGIVRLGIERTWSVETFGKVSLSLNISNMTIKAISAVALVLYPTLRRTAKEALPRLYEQIRLILVSFGIAMMCFYYPLQYVLSLWLPAYSDALQYLAILFPVCIFEGKSSLLINTYFKTYRMEKELSKCNVVTLAVSCIAVFIFTYVMKSLDFAVLSILFILMFKCVICEIVLSRRVGLSVLASLVPELFMTFAFVFLNWFGGVAGWLAYVAIVIGFYFVNAKKIRITVGSFITR